MRDGIMNMQQIKVIIFNNIHHCTGKSSFIWWIIKQWIGGNLHFMIKYIGYKSTQSYRLLVSNKMHLVTFLSQVLFLILLLILPIPPKVG